MQTLSDARNPAKNRTIYECCEYIVRPSGHRHYLNGLRKTVTLPSEKMAKNAAPGENDTEPAGTAFGPPGDASSRMGCFVCAGESHHSPFEVR